MGRWGAKPRINPQRPTLRVAEYINSVNLPGKNGSSVGGGGGGKMACAATKKGADEWRGRIPDLAFCSD